MMKLSQTARFFNRTPFSDAYDPLVQGTCRVMTYDDNSRDSLSTERRIMSVVAGTTIPSRRVVRVGDDRWIVGNSSTDHHLDEPMHQKYVLHRADELAAVKTFAQVLQGVEGKSIWAGRLLVKQTKEPTESSALFNQYQIYCAAQEELRDEALTSRVLDGRDASVLVEMAGRWHVLRGIATTAAGLQVALADEMPEPVVVDVEFTAKTLDLVTESRVDVVRVARGINLRWQSYYFYHTTYTPKFEEGDSVLVILKGATTPTAGDMVKMFGRTYRVISVADPAPLLDHDSVWNLHLRHA
jgi:hypothetical protein